MERKGFTANACAISLVTQSLLEVKSRKLHILRLKVHVKYMFDSSAFQYFIQF